MSGNWVSWWKPAWVFVWCCAVLYCTALCCTLLFCALLYSWLRYSTLLYFTLLYYTTYAVSGILYLVYCIWYLVYCSAYIGVWSVWRICAGAGGAVLPPVQLRWRRRHGIGHGGLEGLEAPYQQTPPLLQIAHGKPLYRPVYGSLYESLCESVWVSVWMNVWVNVWVNVCVKRMYEWV